MEIDYGIAFQFSEVLSLQRLNHLAQSVRQRAKGPLNAVRIDRFYALCYVMVEEPIEDET